MFKSRLYLNIFLAVLLLSFFFALSYFFKKLDIFNYIIQFYFDYKIIFEKYSFFLSFLFFLIFVAWVAFLFPLISLLQLFTGFIYGAYLGTIISIICICIGSVVIYYYPFDRLFIKYSNKLDLKIDNIRNRLLKNEFFYLLLIRVFPGVPFFFQGIIASFFKVNLFKFILSTIIGLLPISFIVNSLGAHIDQSILISEGSQLAIQKNIFYYLPFLFLILLYITKLLIGKVYKKKIY